MTVITTSYASEAELVVLLERHLIHTVICCFNPSIAEVFDAQERLIRASAEAGCVKRFMPSEFAIDYEMDDEYVAHMIALRSSLRPFSCFVSARLVAL